MILRQQFAPTFVLLIAFNSSSLGAMVTTNESGIDTIFSQATFGTTPIDVRFDPVFTIINDDALNIDSGFDFFALIDLAPNPDSHVNLFFIDSITWCGGNNPAIVGCGTTPGDVIAVESVIAAGTFGAELIAHEMSHNLGLGHSGAGLMGSTLNGNTSLTASEVNTIRNSSLVQTDASGSFINVTPILVTATAVPEPSAMGFFAIFSAGLVLRRRRPKSVTS
ncbi:PEP-CTERM sorting domain-containing protein [Planctomycetes bacterium K23_9]|uniref:PEP-CTERM protein-sorting domain-containing protein n=1 Tax=Stieleria marina TaxID=1930275 RepID=A0A517P1Y0_9BACT|nr:hypothetical protein K239x_54040 [Planctomycetes bacterium K23_9]